MSTSTPDRLTRNVTDGARTVADGARSAGRASVSLLRDGGYATVGATDAAVAYARRLGARATEVRDELHGLRLPDPRTVTKSIRGFGAEVEQQFETYASRGREVVASLQRGRAARTATGRADVARSQARAAATSVRRAGEAAGEAVEDAADQVGARADYASMTVEELRALARERDIGGRSEMNKVELVRALRDS
jgi:hypothetical protein